MGDGNSWCTCTKKYAPTGGYNTDGCPVHDKRDTFHYDIPEGEVETITDDRGRTTGWMLKRKKS